MSNIKNNIKSLKIKYSVILVSIFFGFISLLYTYLLENNDYITVSKLLVGFCLGFIHFLLILTIIDNMSKSKKLMYLFLSTLITYFIFDIYILHTLGYSVNFEHLNLIYNNGMKNFVKQSGLSYHTIVYFLIFIIFLNVVFYIIFSKILIYISKKIKIPFFIPLTIIIVVLDILISSYKIYRNPDTIYSVYAKSIPWRPSININIKRFYYTIKQNSLNDSNIHIIDKGKGLPNIVIFMAESLRADMMTKSVMPNLNKLEGKKFINNFSTSNGTFYSVFSVLYGLFPNYYWNTIDKTEATLINLTKQLDYSNHFYSSSSIKWVKMDSFIKNNSFDSFDILNQQGYLKDDQNIVNKFIDNFGSSAKSEFHFIITNSSHFPYSFPKEKKFEKFQPYHKGSINFLDPYLYNKKLAIFNKYKNSITYIDYLILKVTNDIKKKNKWNNTIFIFFGDHGEEFYEEKHFTHAANLNLYQNSAGLFIHSPYDSKKTTVSKTTSHLDIVPTILSILEKSGLKYKHPKWLKGKNIYSNNYKERAVFSTNINMKTIINSGNNFSLNFKNTIFAPLKIENDSFRKKLIDENIHYLLEFEK